VLTSMSVPAPTSVQNMRNVSTGLEDMIASVYLATSEMAMNANRDQPNTKPLRLITAKRWLSVMTAPRTLIASKVFACVNRVSLEMARNAE
jgi:hypothetical protein